MSLLTVQNLAIGFHQEGEVIQAVRGVSFTLNKGETLALVGESGSGKSVTALSTVRLLSDAAEVTGSIRYAGTEMVGASESALRRVRGNDISFIFQEPMTSLNPLHTVERQITESLALHQGVKGASARSRVVELLTKVGIRDPESRILSFPHQLSGGQRQRVMIAMALANKPDLLIADEPTTALDVTVQAQILQLIKDMQAEMGMGLVMITHDLGVIAETVDRVTVMYGGFVMEEAPTADLFDRPAHPYTRALLESVPGALPGRQRLAEIPGSSPDPAALPQGCPFHPRCARAHERCRTEAPPLVATSDARATACWSPV